MANIHRIIYWLQSRYLWGGASNIRGTRESLIFGNDGFIRNDLILRTVPWCNNGVLKKTFGELRPFVILDYGLVFVQPLYGFTSRYHRYICQPPMLLALALRRFIRAVLVFSYTVLPTRQLRFWRASKWFYWFQINTFEMRESYVIGDSHSTYKTVNYHYKSTYCHEWIVVLLDSRC